MRKGEERVLPYAEAIFDSYAGTVHALVLRATGDRDSAETVTLDVVRQVAAEVAEAEAAAPVLEARVLSLARARALELVRQGRAAEGDTPPAPAAPDSEDLVERRRFVRHALAGLSPSQRRALELAYFEGRTLTEIAAVLAEPVESIRIGMRQSMNVLRRVLAPLLPPS